MWIKNLYSTGLHLKFQLNQSNHVDKWSDFVNCNHLDILSLCMLNYMVTISSHVFTAIFPREYVLAIRGPPFSLEWGVMIFRKYLGNIFVTPPIWWSKILWPPPPPGATMLKKHVTPNARSAENMHFWGGYFIEQNFH